MAVVPLNRQYEHEKELNLKYLVLSLILNLILPLIHGTFLVWLPWILRHHRNQSSLRFSSFFSGFKLYLSLTRVFLVSIMNKRLYFQPSLLLIAAMHLGLNGLFCIAQTEDIYYTPKVYVVAKRLGLVSVAQVPAVMLLITKNNFVSAISGLSTDKSIFFHKWMGRFMFVTAILHMALSLQYWIGIKFYIMVKIPPQIFGFIAFSCLGMLNLGSMKFIRNFAFDLFLAQHRVFNFVFLLLAYFHNSRTHFSVLLGVHLLVLDRIAARVIGIIHKRKSPTKGKCDFEILDESTIRVSIPIKVSASNPRKWWWSFVPRYGSWKAGQHVYFNCNKVALLQYHPFTISSLPSSGKMVLVIRKKQGFTLKLYKKLEAMESSQDVENSIEENSIEELSSVSCKMSLSSCEKNKTILDVSTTLTEETLGELLDGFTEPKIYTIKAGINGPFGGNYQPLIKFESVILLAAGSGCSFALPVALDLLKEIEERDGMDDFLFRPKTCKVEIHATFQKKAHLQWYGHIWKEFEPFISSGKLLLFLYFTKEHVETRQDASQTLETSSTSGEKSTNSDLGLISLLKNPQKHFRRPDIDSIVGSNVASYSSQRYQKSIAFLGCGPSDFNYTVDKACRKNQWLPGAPSIYKYLETFD